MGLASWAALAVSAAGLALLGIAARVHHYGRRSAAQPRGEAIVVLGAKLFGGGQPSPAFLGRIERGVELWREGAAPLLVFSGGGAPSEARAALEHARALGVDPAACLLEETSTNTRQNAEHCAPLLRARAVRRVVLVTDGFHLLRAARCFRALGFEVTPAASRRRLTARTWAWAMVKETAAYLRLPPRGG